MYCKAQKLRSYGRKMLIFCLESKPTACSLFLKIAIYRYVFYVHFLLTSARNEPKKRRTGGEVSFAKKQTSRIFAPFNILPLVDPPLAVEGGREQLIKVKY